MRPILRSSPVPLRSKPLVAMVSAPETAVINPLVATVSPASERFAAAKLIAPSVATVPPRLTLPGAAKTIDVFAEIPPVKSIFAAAARTTILLSLASVPLPEILLPPSSIPPVASIAPFWMSAPVAIIFAPRPSEIFAAWVVSAPLLAEKSLTETILPAVESAPLATSDSTPPLCKSLVLVVLIVRAATATPVVPSVFPDSARLSDRMLSVPPDSAVPDCAIAPRDVRVSALPAKSVPWLVIAVAPSSTARLALAAPP